MKKYQSLKIKIKSYLKSLVYHCRKKEFSTGLKLNLGCGYEYKDGWVNIDLNKSVRTDICCDFINLKNHFTADSVELIYMIHSISYLNLWEANTFFLDSYKILSKGGVLEMEFPDIEKCAKLLIDADNFENFTEAVRGVFAFDLDQIQNRESFRPYSFGWSGKYMKEVLQNIGFAKVEILEPLTHGRRSSRDTRIVATK